MLKLKPKHAWSKHPEFEGTTPFELAVNKREADYYEAFGVALPMEMACFDVLAELYNKIDAMLKVTEENRAEEKKDT